MAGAPTPLTNLIRRLERLERDLDATRSLWRQMIREAKQGVAPRVRLVQTFKPEGESYPTPVGNTFHVRFVDLTQSLWTPGTQGLTITPRSATEQDTAATFDRRWILPDQLCTALRANRKWWIIDGPGLQYFGRLKAALTKGATVAMDLLKYNGSKWVDSGFDMNVTDKFLNSSQTLDVKTKVEVRMQYPGKYFVINGPCNPDDTPDEEYEEEE